MIYFYLLGCIGFMILQGFFAATEISFISSRLLQLRFRHNQGDKKAGKVYRLILSPEKLLITTLTGTNLSVVMSSSLITIFLIDLGVKESNFWTTVFFTPLVVIFAELIPKNIGRSFKEDFSCKAVDLIILFEKLFTPIVKSVELVSKFLVKTFIGKVRYRSLFVTKEEIRSMIKEMEHQGGIDKGEKEAIEGVFELKINKIKELSVRLRSVVSIDYADSAAQIMEKVKQKELTRYPVFRNREVVGYLNIYDLFYNPQEDWRSFIRPIMRVEFDQKLYEVFTRLKSKRESIALVCKGQRPWGVITLQDIIRETITSIVKI